MTKATGSVNPRDIAQFAAEGVANALSAQSTKAGARTNAELQPPWKIIIGLMFPKPALFEAELVKNGNEFRVGAIAPHDPSQ